MTCAWPACGDAQCARCLVLDRCRAQQPNDDFQWVESHGYDQPFGGDYHLLPLLSRVDCARRVADRLIAWLAWPGRGGLCSDHPEAPVLVRIPGELSVSWQDPHDVPRLVPLASVRNRRVIEQHGECSVCGGSSCPALHPLDGTPAAALRAQVQPWYTCPQCNQRGITRATRDVCDFCNGTRSVQLPVPDWPTVAVICDVLDERALWSEVHAWRPSPEQPPEPRPEPRECTHGHLTCGMCQWVGGVSCRYREYSRLQPQAIDDADRNLRQRAN